MLHYTVANTFGTEDDDNGKEVYAIRHDTVRTLYDVAYRAPGDYRTADVVAVWNTPDNEMGTKPDWVGMVNVYGELMELADRYRDQVAL